VARQWQVAMAVPLWQTSATSARHPNNNESPINEVGICVSHSAKSMVMEILPKSSNIA